MFSRIRKRATYANVAMTFALVFAMSGGAYAAKHYLITSIKQINPKVVAQLKGKQGKQGAQGLQGPAGKDGATGATGLTGKEGLAGKEGKEGKEGPAGEPWTPNSELPKNATETGSWAANGGEGEGRFVGLSFPVQLAAELEESNVKIAPNPECPGTAAEPKAEPGFLCIYVGENVGNKAETPTQVFKPYELVKKGAGKGGAVLLVKGEAAGGAWIMYGTWAVTAS